MVQNILRLAQSFVMERMRVLKAHSIDGKNAVLKAHSIDGKNAGAESPFFNNRSYGTTHGLTLVSSGDLLQAIKSCGSNRPRLTAFGVLSDAKMKFRKNVPESGKLHTSK
jgi:hypothetical protein